MAVLVVLTVRLVVLAFVGDDITQRLPVMRGDEVDARPRAASAAVEEVSAAGNAVGELGTQSRIAAPEAARGIAELVVPFGETGRMIAQLITTGSNIPRFGNQFQPIQHRILSQHIEEA